MTEAEVRAVALVRAVDESPHARALLPATMLVEAQLVAGDPADAEAWFVHRARYLLDGVLAPVRPLAERFELRVRAFLWIVPLAAAVGLLANSFGPTAKIHAVYNPIVLLLAWNVLVYLGLGFLRLRRRPAPGAGGAPLGMLGRFTLGPIAQRLLSARVQAGPWREHATAEMVSLGPRFVRSWLAMMRPALKPALRCLCHLGAIGMAAGAVAGMYVRGLFFEYDVVWRSTFVTDPHTIERLCDLLLLPGALVLGRPGPGAADVAALLSRAGSPAAPWIHLYAATIAVVVGLPRLGLALANAAAYRRALGCICLDPQDRYVREMVALAARLDAREVRQSIEHDVRAACQRFADDVAVFVADELWDRRIVPTIERFRERGGTLVELDAQLAECCRTFEATLATEVARAQRALEGRLAEQIAWRLGEIEPADAIASDRVQAAVDGASSGAGAAVSEQVGNVLTTGFGSVVTGATAVVAGTVSGGFGHALGTALLVGIVHSGPVGWLLGALGGGALAGAGLYLGRERVREGVKRVTLPPFVAKLALLRFRTLKKAGREQCVRDVRHAIAGELEDVVQRISERIWQRLEPRLGERLRPSVVSSAAAPV
ncbi:MAG TPA: DUF2868 domain-containing protein [Candidatus Limnocylindria bacterium]|nr:DUF2868 domain-containing protein [Candidatus Limnocylindria bacterium]